MDNIKTVQPPWSFYNNSIAHHVCTSGQYSHHNCSTITPQPTTSAQHQDSTYSHHDCSTITRQPTTSAYQEYLQPPWLFYNNSTTHHTCTSSTVQPPWLFYNNSTAHHICTTSRQYSQLDRSTITPWPTTSVQHQDSTATLIILQ